MPAAHPSDGPVAVTGASGYIGAHAVRQLMKRGFKVHACVTDASVPAKVDHIKSMNDEGHPGSVEIMQGNILDEGSYDPIFSECGAVLHVGTPMLYGGINTPRETYDGMVNGTVSVMESARKAGTVKRFVYTSSFAAIGHPVPSGYRYTENDWGDMNRDRDPSWSVESIDGDGGVAYAMAKVETERLVNKYAEEQGGFDAISVCPCVVLGPLLSTAHECLGSWQWALARMVEGKDCPRGWQALWNVVDVRDVAEAHAAIVESDTVEHASRYQLTATDETGEINVYQLQEHLQNSFPELDIGGPPPAIEEFLARRGKIHDGPRAHCTKAIEDLGLKTHSIEDTLQTTAQTSIDLGLCKPKRKAS